MTTHEHVTIIGQPATEATETVLAYHRAIDTGHATDAISLFTDDAVFQAKGTELLGRDAIRVFMTDREAQAERHTVHVVANLVVRRAQDDEVELSALVLLHVRQPDGGYALERVLDTTHVVTRDLSGWKIHRRLSRPLHDAAPTFG